MEYLITETLLMIGLSWDLHCAPVFALVDTEN